MDHQQIEIIRSFNRFYTNILGLLEKHLLHSKYTLVEVRILFEIHKNEKTTASDLINTLHIDKGYLSRILKKMNENDLVKKINSKKDRRQAYLELTKLGFDEFQKRNQAANAQISSITNTLQKDELSELVSHMNSIKKILSKR